MLQSKRVLALILFVFTVFSSQIHAQAKPGELIDGIAAVIGNEIVLESDILEQMNFSKQEGNQVNDKCEFLGRLLNNKLLIYEAKRDTLIENRADAIREMSNNKFQQIAAQFPDEKAMLKAYGFRTAYEMKTMIEKYDSDQYYGQEKYKRVTSGADMTPNEVTDFYNQYKFQLPEVKDEVSLAQIVMYPKLTEAHKQELRDKLLKIKKDIEGGETFENLARIYSEDPGSASNGGLYTNVAKGQMVKPFEAAALNLQEGEMSEPVESDYGFHLIQLVKKSGKNYDVKHILLNSTPTKDEMIAAKKELDSIRTLIEEKKMTFREAAYKFSDDKGTKFNAGVITNQDGKDKLEKVNLPAVVAYQIAGLNKGDMTEVYEDEANKRKTVNMLMINDVIPAHQLDIATDYERIREFALNKKRGELVEKYVKEQLPSIFVSINKRYDTCEFNSLLKKEVPVAKN